MFMILDGLLVRRHCDVFWTDSHELPRAFLFHDLDDLEKHHYESIQEYDIVTSDSPADRVAR